jgi:hypothetical protein
MKYIYIYIYIYIYLEMFKKMVSKVSYDIKGVKEEKLRLINNLPHAPPLILKILLINRKRKGEKIK